MPLPKPPATFVEFTEAFPQLAASWSIAQQAGEEGPLDKRERRLVKLAVAVGSLREGAVHSAVRKAKAEGVTVAEMHQVLALAATTLGFPSTVAAWSWVRDELADGRSDTEATQKSSDSV